MRSYQKHFSDKSFIISFISGAVLLATSLVIQSLASNYTEKRASASVTDIVLSNIPVYDVDGIFAWGAVILLVLGIVVSMSRINYMPFAMKSVALFTLIRSIFVSLTHISPFPSSVLMAPEFFKHTLFDGVFKGYDLFFSGHTGMPFLLALIFWEHKKLRYIFLGFSATFAVVVLLGHLHYSIDVLAAYFITFTIFQMCKYLFQKDWQLFLSKQD